MTYIGYVAYTSVAVAVLWWDRRSQQTSRICVNVEELFFVEKRFDSSWECARLVASRLDGAVPVAWTQCYGSTCTLAATPVLFTRVKASTPSRIHDCNSNASLLVTWPRLTRRTGSSSSCRVRCHWMWRSKVKGRLHSRNDCDASTTRACV